MLAHYGARLGKILRQSATSRAANDKMSASFAARAWKNKSQPSGQKKNDTEIFQNDSKLGELLINDATCDT